jgi:ribonuclease HI
MAMIMALEAAASKGWCNIWLESDSKTALEALANPNMVPLDLRNHWSNCLSLGLNIKYSHIFRECN